MAYTLDDEREDKMLVVEHPYFETEAPLRGEVSHSYIASREVLSAPVIYEWNHGIGEVVQAVLDAGMRLIRLEEHAEIEWPFLGWMEPTARGSYVLPERPERLPLMYSLEAIKDANPTGSP
jgi:hypothetical protein